MMKDLATSTNAYTKARRNNWREVDASDPLELDLFFALHVLLGLSNLARYNTCFRDSADLGRLFYKGFMSARRFADLNRYLHVVHPDV